jgi:SAM-dependent MidA family methyltransferase
MLLTLDYGFPERELYHASRAAGTLVGYHNHTVVSDPLQNPGYVDLTSHVNFSGLVRQGEEQRWRLHGFTTQSWFLMGLGLLERLEGIRSRMGTDPTGDPSWEQIKMAAMRLIMPNAMGERFHALALTKGLDTSPLAGFRLNNRNAAF